LVVGLFNNAVSISYILNRRMNFEADHERWVRKDFKLGARDLLKHTFPDIPRKTLQKLFRQDVGG
jgi:hypothetical protein